MPTRGVLSLGILDRVECKFVGRTCRNPNQWSLSSDVVGCRRQAKNSEEAKDPISNQDSLSHIHQWELTSILLQTSDGRKRVLNDSEQGHIILGKLPVSYLSLLRRQQHRFQDCHHPPSIVTSTVRIHSEPIYSFDDLQLPKPEAWSFQPTKPSTLPWKRHR